MDADKGGFCAADNWRNDIDGSGSLTKKGSGMLVLSGDNSYTGGTTVEGGTIRADYDSAFGDGNVVNNSTITENTTGTLAVHGNFTQIRRACWKLRFQMSRIILQLTERQI